MMPIHPKSLRERLLVSTMGMLCVMVFLAIWTLFATSRMQLISNRHFEQQRSLQDIQRDLEEFQAPLLGYLSTRSSDALASILILMQHIDGKLPKDHSISSDPILLAETEVYNMIASYLERAENVIQERRGMDIARYTAIYDDMQILLAFINERIDAISTERFSRELSNYDSFIHNTKNIQILNLVFILSTSLFSLISVWQVTSSTSNPITHLSQAAMSLSNGNFESPDIAITGILELDNLIGAFNRMKNDIHNYINELRWQRNVEQEYLQERVQNMKMKEVLRTMELYTLQAQMNPHFLFNTLNTGIQLAIIENADRTVEYMEHVARLLRYNMAQKDVLTSIKSELDGLSTYFAILKVRFPQTLDLLLDIPPALPPEMLIPSAILQPLVENCIVHAFRNKSGKQIVQVRIQLEEGSLCLQVEDNGCGMEEEVIEKLLSREESDTTFHKVMGLENVIHRLRFLYPEHDDILTISSRKGEGSCVAIRIPREAVPCTMSS